MPLTSLFIISSEPKNYEKKKSGYRVSRIQRTVDTKLFFVKIMIIVYVWFAMKR